MAGNDLMIRGNRETDALNNLYENVCCKESYAYGSAPASYKTRGRRKPMPKPAGGTGGQV